jgi:hypothetical protein
MHLPLTGGIPDNGRKAAEESRKEILGLVQGCDLVFVTAGARRVMHFCQYCVYSCICPWFQ